MKTVKFYFSHNHFNDVMRKKHAYFNGLTSALNLHGFTVAYAKIEDHTKFVAGIMEDYAILDRMLLGRDNCFTLRRAIYVPYWSVETSENADGFRLFNKEFDASSVDHYAAQAFAETLRRKNIGTKEPITDFGDGVLIPLQSHMLDQHYGQSMALIDMIRSVREHEPNRPIYLQRNPADDLRPAEIEALEGLCKEIDAEINEEPKTVLLRKSRYIATMNSGFGFEGLVYGLPLMLYGDADFRHVAVNVKDYDNMADAFEAINQPAQNYDRYVKWYLDDNMISARKPDAIPRTFDYFRELGMDIEKF